MCSPTFKAEANTNRLRSDSIFVSMSQNGRKDSNSPKSEENESKQKSPALNLNVSPLLKAYRDTTSMMSHDDRESEQDLHYNPFTKSLFNRLGPEFNQSNFYNKNKKMFRHLNMLDGVALCDENYRGTFLDSIKINGEDLQTLDFNNKPTHIDKLFEKEEEFLQNSIAKNKICTRFAVRNEASSFCYGQPKSSFTCSKSRRPNKRKRQRINSNSSIASDLDEEFYRVLSPLKCKFEALRKHDATTFHSLLTDKTNLRTKFSEAFDRAVEGMMQKKDFRAPELLIGLSLDFLDHLFVNILNEEQKDAISLQSCM